MSTETETTAIKDEPQADEWEQIGVFRLNCADATKPQLFYGPIDVAAELAENGIEPTAAVLRALAGDKKGKGRRRAPQVTVERAPERGQPPIKRLSRSTLAGMLRDVGLSMQLQTDAM